MRLLIVLLFGLLSLQAHAQKQGIKGKVFWLSGNQMPGPEKVSLPQQGISREIHIYKVVTLNDAVQQDNFWIEIKTELVATTISKPDGSFKIKLPPGEYSLFTKEPQGLYANLFDRNNKINPVSVRAKRFSWITITVDYEASY